MRFERDLGNENYQILKSEEEVPLDDLADKLKEVNGAFDMLRD